MHFCPHCGAQLQNGARFCHMCGSTVYMITDSDEITTAGAPYTPAANTTQSKAKLGLTVVGFVLSMASVFAVLVDYLLMIEFWDLIGTDLYKQYELIALLMAIPCIPGIALSAMAIAKKHPKRGFSIAGVAVGSAVFVYALISLIIILLP